MTTFDSVTLHITLNPESRSRLPEHSLAFYVSKGTLISDGPAPDTELCASDLVLV